MRAGSAKRVSCAIYTRVSTDQGLEQDFNSLDAQYDASQAYIRSQAHAGWTLIRSKYDDGGFSGGNTDRPALQQLLQHVRTGKVDVIVVYKVDRLTRSLADFAKLVDLFDQHKVSFVSVTQQFNTTTSMGRLTLNVLLSFAQFEREVTSERIRDKIAASKRKGLWVGGMAPLGYDAKNRKIRVNEAEAERVRTIFRSYLRLGSLNQLTSLINDYVARVEVRPDRLLIELARAGKDSTSMRRRTALNIPWHKVPSRRRREILLAEAIQPKQAQPIRSETRATLIASIARGRRWLNELITKPTANTDCIAKRQRCSVRQVNMTMSLAFLAPNLVRAAIEGRLPRGIGVTRLRDAPAEWSRQHAMLGLPQ
jgi:DNA invertase Pin-like site-specific DNA recombinase